METTVPGTLVWGHAALAVCAALYLAWWWTFFNPAMPKATGALYAVGVGFILGAVAFGIAAVVLLAMGLGALAGAPCRLAALLRAGRSPWAACWPTSRWPSSPCASSSGP